MVCEPRAPVVLLGEAIPLEHRAHRAVQHEDPLPEEALELGKEASVACANPVEVRAFQAE